jgi:membrane-bound metal-dependent hydrolase YbcI (DUF457 family)
MEVEHPVDFLTHGAVGAFIAWTWPRRWAVPKAAATSVTAALLPDVDIFLPDPFNPDATLAHRGFTHSLFGVAVLAPLVAIVPWWLSKQKRAYWSLVALVALGMISHLVLDLPTEVGLKIFWPFYPKPVYLEWLSGIDLTLFTVSLFVPLAAWTYAKPGQALRRGIFSSAFLVVFCWWLFAGWPLIGGRLGSSLQTEEQHLLAGPRRNATGSACRHRARELELSGESWEVRPTRLGYIRCVSVRLWERTLGCGQTDRRLHASARHQGARTDREPI